MASCSMMSCGSTSSPCWPWPCSWSAWPCWPWPDRLGQHDDNVAFVYLLRLHPLLGHLLRAKLNESKPSWGTYPTMVAELISWNVGCMRATENLTNFKFPDHPSRRVYFNLTFNHPRVLFRLQRRVFFSRKIIFPDFTCSGPLYFNRKEKRCHDS